MTEENEDVNKTQPATTAGAGNTEGTNAGDNPKSFTQEDVNELIAKRVNAEKARNQSAITDAVNTAIAEYERTAKLSKDEKDKEEKAKREAEIQAREESITLRERRIEAQDILLEKGISVKLVDFVVNMDKEKTVENIETLAKEFNLAVESGVNAKLKGTPPEDFGNAPNGTTVKGMPKSF